MYGYSQWLHRLVYENMIDSEHRKSRRECTSGAFRSNDFARIAQTQVKCAIGSRTADTIEVAK